MSYLIFFQSINKQTNSIPTRDIRHPYKFSSVYVSVSYNHNNGENEFQLIVLN